MKKYIFSAFTLLAVGLTMTFLPGAARAQTASAPAPIPIWPASFLAAAPQLPPEHDTTTAQDALVGGRPVIRLTDVSMPTITVFRPDAAKNTGMTVVVFPGGGYKILAMDIEGTEICKWLNSVGVTAVLVQYRVPTGAPHTAAFEDAQRAVRLVRGHAREWKLDPARIGVMGFSAGGDLVARLSTGYATRTYVPIDKFDRVSCRPDFSILIYPAYLAAHADDFERLQLASDLRVTPATPASFLVQAQDDPVGVMNSIDYYVALTQHHVPAAMHLYVVGGHGYGLRPSGHTIATWPARLEDWLRVENRTMEHSSNPR